MHYEKYKYYKRFYDNGNDIIFKPIETSVMGDSYIWSIVVWTEREGVLDKPYRTHIYREYPSGVKTVKLSELEVMTMLL